MMPQSKLHGTIILDGKRYRLNRKIDSNQVPSTFALTQRSLNDPPYSEGLPSVLSDLSFTWHMGGFKSRQGVVGTSEYGVNTDGRWPFRLAPGPQISTVTLTGSDGQVCYVWLSGTYIYVVTETDRLYRINRITGAAQLLMSGGITFGTSEGTSEGYGGQPIAGFYWSGVDYWIDSAKRILPIGVLNSPTGAGASTQWTPSAGSNWQNVDDGVVPDDDTTYNASATLNQRDMFACGGAARSTADIRLWVGARVRRTDTTGADPGIKLSVRSGATNGDSIEFILPDDTDWHTLWYYWDLDPSTAANWTEANAEAAEIGYILSTAPGAGEVRITQLFKTFGYSDAKEAQAHEVVAGPRRLFKVDSTDLINGTLKNLVPGLDVMDESQWGDSVTIPDMPKTPSAFIGHVIAPYQKTVIVNCNRGIYAVDDDGRGIQIINRLSNGANNMYPLDPWIMISHTHGLIRWMPGLVESVGLENEILNESPVRGNIYGMAAIGKWLYCGLQPPTGNSHIIVGREVQGNEPAYGPMVWDTLIELGSSARPITLVADTTSFWGHVLVFPRNSADIGYCIFPATQGGAPDIDSSSYRFSTSGTRFSPRYRFDDWKAKSFSRVQVKGQGLDANTYWEIAYSIDGGAWVTTDINGATMRVNSNSLTTFLLPTTATGAEIQFRFTYTGASATAAGYLTYFEPFAIPQSNKTFSTTVELLLEGEQAYEDGSRETRTPVQQYNDLKALTETGAVDATVPWSESAVTIVARGLELTEMRQDGNGAPRFVVQLGLQDREAA